MKKSTHLMADKPGPLNRFWIYCSPVKIECSFVDDIHTEKDKVYYIQFFSVTLFLGKLTVPFELN